MIQFAKQMIDLSWDLLTPAAPEQILSGNKFFRPLMKHQNAWMQHFYPGHTINTKINPWVYLQKYMMPLVKKNASSYHLKGIEYLALDTMEKPDFKTFQRQFYDISNGFSIETVTHEITPFDYFSLIQQKKFPCIEKLRDHNELFCANEPDFWHEAIGHIAPLCFEEVQTFYLETAEHFLAAKDLAEIKQNQAVTWTVMEYAFLKEQDQYKMFGAALVGSHLANMRYLHGQISIEPADRVKIIESGVYGSLLVKTRNSNGRLRFFGLDHLNADILFKNYHV